MRISTLSIRSFLLFPLLMCSAGSNAQVVDISECRALTDRLARFDCYEKLAEEPDPVTAGQVINEPSIDAPVQIPAETAAVSTVENVIRPPAIQQEEAVREEQPATVADFGRQAQESARLVTGEDEESELHDEITALEQSGPNRWLVTLSSGQVWRQMEGKPYRLRVGDEVRIYQTFWGNAYRLTAPRLASFIQVERVK